MKSYADIQGDGGSNIVGQVGALVERLQARMATIGRVIAVTSGKGGVGKSSVTVNLAAALAKDGLRIGILDADLNGPSIAKMAGVRSLTPKVTDEGILPPIGPEGMKILSMDHFLPDDATPVAWNATTQQDAYTWRPTLEMTALREMLTDTVWGELDCLLLDLPPGSDRLPNVAGLLPPSAGALTITVPSGVSQLVVRRAVESARDVMGDRMLGLIDNMTAYLCPHCHEEGPLFPKSESIALAEEMGIAHLGGIPFDPEFAAACDKGTPYVLQAPSSPVALAFTALGQSIRPWLDEARSTPVSPPSPVQTTRGEA